MTSPVLAIVKKIEENLNAISTDNGYNLNYSEIEYADDTPAEYNQRGLYWRDGKDKGEFSKTQDSQLMIVVDAIIPATKYMSAHKLGTLAREDLKRCFKSIGVCGAMSTKWESDKWLETKGRTVCRVYFTVLVKYNDNI